MLWGGKKVFQEKNCRRGSHGSRDDKPTRYSVTTDVLALNQFAKILMNSGLFP